MSTLRLIALPGLIAHIILIHVERLTHDLCTGLVGLLDRLRLIALLGRLVASLGLIPHIILIHVERLTHDFRTGFAGLLDRLRLIALLGLISPLSGFSFLHFGLQEYRKQSLRNGRDCRCKPHAKHVQFAELVKIAHKFSSVAWLPLGRRWQ
jgi:hypothetical protein